MKKNKLLLISSLFATGLTLFTTVSCNKKETVISTNQNTTLLKQEIDLSQKYNDKFAINQGEQVISEEQVLNILNENRNVLFSNLPLDAKLSITKIIFSPNKGEIEVDITSDKYQDEQGKLILQSKFFNKIKLTGFKKQGISTYINYDDSTNKGIDLSQTLPEIKNQKPSDWAKNNTDNTTPTTENKENILKSIKSKIKDIAWAKDSSVLNLENVLITKIEAKDDQSLVSVEVEFKSSIWWENAIQKDFKTSINFFGFKSIEQDTEIKNTIVNPNEQVLQKITEKTEGTEKDKTIYVYSSDSFKDIEIKEDDNLENNENKLLEFIKSKKMFIHNYEDSNISISEETESSNNKENIKKGFLDFKITFENKQATTKEQNSETETNGKKEFNLRLQGFKIQNDQPENNNKVNLSIKSSKWYRKNENTTSNDEKVNFFYGINVILNGEFENLDANFINNIFGSLKYKEDSGSDFKEVKLSPFILEQIDENTLSLFFAHKTWTSQNYPNGGKIFEDTELSLSIVGYESVKTKVISGIDEVEVENVSAHISNFGNKTYRVFKFDFYSPQGGLPQIYSGYFSKDYSFEFTSDTNSEKVVGNSYIYSWTSGTRATVYVLNEEKWNSDQEFEKYKNGTKISINVAGFKIKEIYFKDTNKNSFNIDSAKWNKDDEKYFIEVELSGDNLSTQKEKKNYQAILEFDNERLILTPFSLEITEDNKKAKVKFTYSKWYLKEIGSNQKDLKLAYLIVRVDNHNNSQHKENIDPNNMKPKN